MASKIRNDHAMTPRELDDYRLEHLASNHQPMNEQERRSASVLGKGDAVRHRALFNVGGRV
jgi:hypothetical protein